MKAQEHNYGFDSVLPDNRTPFMIESNAGLFEILSSTIYKDKILAVIRELSCNAYDAHVEAKKKEVPFKLRLPTRIDPTFYIEDEGPGIDPERIVEIYWTYGRSSKKNTNDQIGFLGLGSKSPFAYTKSSFVVKNRYKGVEYTYLCFINEDGKPDGSRVSEEPTEKHSGVTVEFAVRPEDISAFYNRADRFFKRWTAVKPTLIDQVPEAVFVTKIEKVIEGTDWYLEKNAAAYGEHSGAIAMQGNVPYPIEASSIPRLPPDLMIIAGNPFVITFDMGEVKFIASREALSYEERTCTNVIARLQEVRQELETSFRAKVFKPGMTQPEFLTTFRYAFKEFRDTVKYSGDAKQAVDWFIKLLLNQSKDDSVSYDGGVYKILEILDGKITLTYDGHQAFGIYRHDHRSERSSRMFMHQQSRLKYVANEVIDAPKIHPTWNSTSTIDVGEEIFFDWKNFSLPKRGELGIHHRVFKEAPSFDATTLHQLPVVATMKFYVNDVGASGEARFRAMTSGLGSFLVNFDPKISSPEVVISQLTELLGKSMKGAEIKRLSTEPDYRPPVDRVKLDPGTMKVKYKKIVLEQCATNNSVDGSNATYKLFDVERNGEAVIKVADLQAQAIVPYVIKRRSRTALFDTNNRPSIITKTDLMPLAMHYLLQDLVTPLVQEQPSEKGAAGRDSLKVYVLNDGQIAWLKARKVNLIEIRELCTDRIKKLQDAEKFMEKVDLAVSLKEVTVLKNIYHAAVSDSESTLERILLLQRPSIFKELVNEFYVEASNTRALGEMYAKRCIFEKLHIARTTTAATSSDDLEERIYKRYPMLKLIANQYLSKDDALYDVLDYIDLVDQGVAHES